MRLDGQTRLNVIRDSNGQKDDSTVTVSTCVRVCVSVHLQYIACDTTSNNSNNNNSSSSWCICGWIDFFSRDPTGANSLRCSGHSSVIHWAFPAISVSIPLFCRQECVPKHTDRDREVCILLSSNHVEKEG